MLNARRALELFYKIMLMAFFFFICIFGIFILGSKYEYTTEFSYLVNSIYNFLFYFNIIGYIVIFVFSFFISIYSKQIPIKILLISILLLLLTCAVGFLVSFANVITTQVITLGQL